MGTWEQVITPALSSQSHLPKPCTPCTHSKRQRWWEDGGLNARKCRRLQGVTDEIDSHHESCREKKLAREALQHFSMRQVLNGWLMSPTLVLERLRMRHIT